MLETNNDANSFDDGILMNPGYNGLLDGSNGTHRFVDSLLDKNNGINGWLREVLDESCGMHGLGASLLDKNIGMHILVDALLNNVWLGFGRRTTRQYSCNAWQGRRIADTQCATRTNRGSISNCSRGMNIQLAAGRK